MNSAWEWRFVMRRLFGLLSVICSVALALPAQAALEFRPVTLDSGVTVLVVSGEFELNDPVARLPNEIRSSGASVIMFDSIGGNPIAAMNFGRAIRQSGLPTVQVRSMLCVSACALAFLGGAIRFAESGSIGLHKPSFDETANFGRDEAVSAIQSLTAETIDYLIEMGIDPALIKLSLSYESSDMRYLSTSEMLQYRVITDESAPEPDRLAMAPSTTNRPPAAERKSPPMPPPAMDRGQAIDFVSMLIQMHTLPAYQALSQLKQYYGGAIDYYGHVRSIDWVMNDKSDYFARWPTRNYQLRYDTVSATCANGQVCSVTGLYDWSVLSMERRKKASGTASFEFSFTARAPHHVLRETSKVVQRR